MSTVLLHGALVDQGLDALLRFHLSFSSYNLVTPLLALDGAAMAAQQERFEYAFESLSGQYHLGSAMVQDSSDALHPLFAQGVEIVVRYAVPAGRACRIRPRIYYNGDFNLDLWGRSVTASVARNVQLRLVCEPGRLQVYLDDALVYDQDPTLLDWGWVGPRADYWRYLALMAPYDRYAAPGSSPVSVSDNYYEYAASEVPHIAQVIYRTLSHTAPAFFRDFVKSYEIVGEGSSVGPTDPTDPTDPPDDLGNDTVLALSAAPAAPLTVESLPFRAIFNYALGSPGVFPAVFALTLDTGTYKFSTALSPDREAYDTQIALLSFAEDTVYVNDDISDGSDGSPYDRRSEITMALPAGEYAIAVGTSGMIFGADGSLDPSGATQIPPGTVLRVSKV